MSIRKASKRASSASSRSAKSKSAKVSALVSNNPDMRLGAPVSVTRNTTMEKVWAQLLDDPPVDYSNHGRWTTAADVRPSSFPFCGRKYVMERLGLTMPPDFKVKSNVYTGIGSAVHYVVQNAIARTGRLWGMWVCARPSCSRHQKKTAHRSTPGFAPRNERCEECGCEYFEYEELVVSDGKIGLRGHVDGVIVYRGYATVLEVKTAGVDKVEKIKAMSDAEVAKMFVTESPWMGYLHQASTYASLLRLKYKELDPIKYVDYLVVSRDSPDTVASFRLTVPEDNHWWAEIRSRILTAQHARSLRVLPVGFARTDEEIKHLPSCTWCSHKDVCLKPSGRLEYEADALYDEELSSRLNTYKEQEKRAWEQLFVVTE